MSKYEGHTPGDWWAEGDYIAAHVPGGRPNGEIIGQMRPSVDKPGIDRAANASIAADAPKLARVNQELRAENRRLRDTLESHGPDGHNVTNEQHVALREKLKKSELERREWVEREAACCPEDIGFEEMIASQAKRIVELESENRRLRDALKKIEGMYHVIGVDVPDDEHDPHPGQIARAALASTEPEVCKWRRRAKKTTGAIHWIGDCGLACASIAEGVEASNMHYCPKCGKRLEVIDGDL